MLKKNPRATTLIPYLLLCQLLLVPSLMVFAHQKDSLLHQLSETNKPAQQLTILHQLYDLTAHDNFQEAEKYIMAAVDLGMRTSNAGYLLPGYKKLAALYELQKNYMQAYIFYQEAQKIAIEEDYQEELPYLNLAIGMVLYRLDRFSESITFLQNAGSLAAAQLQRPLIPKATVFLGLSYYQSDRKEKAVALFDSLETSLSAVADQSSLAFLYYHLQELYRTAHQPALALQLNEKAIHLFTQALDQFHVISCLKERAAIYAAMDSTERSIAMYRRALNEINAAQHYSSLKISILDALAASHLRLHDPVLAESYERQSKKLSDSLTAMGRSVLLPLQSASYPGVLPTKKNNVQANFSNWPSRIVPLLLVVMAVLSFIFYRRYKKIKLNMEDQSEGALVKAREIATAEKKQEIERAYRVIEAEKQLAVHEAQEIIEKAKAEARELQAQIATTSALLANKTEYLTQLQEKLNTTENIDGKRIAKEIRSNIGDTDYWGEFIRNFNLLHAHTIDKITRKHPDLTPNELKLVCFTLSGLNNKEIAGIFSVEPESVKKARYRLKKKLKLTEEESLRTYLDGLQ